MAEFNYPDVPQKVTDVYHKSEYYKQMKKKKGPTRQDIISKSDFSHLFNGYHLLDADEYNTVPTGSFIRYVTKEGLYRSGGYLIRNCAPVYFKLKNGSSSWSVTLEKQKEIYFKTSQEKQKENFEMNQLYEDYLRGDTVKISEYNDLVDQLTELDSAYQTLFEKHKRIRRQLAIALKKIGTYEKDYLKRTQLL